MKKISVLVAALVLTLGLTQCKKEQTNTANDAQGVQITLNVNGGASTSSAADGSKVIVDPTGHTDPDYATVNFEAGDVIYVGNNGAYCGYLEYDGDASQFSGTVTPTSDADYLHFYFMGNKGEKSGPTSVSITDQTSKYPVISYAHSTTLYSEGTTSYSAKLMNYCAIVKFTTTDIDGDITITGMNNTVTVDFSANNAATSTTGKPYTFSKSGDGDITLHRVSNTERWAILLPQDEVTTATATATGYATESAFTVPEIKANMYHNSGISVELTATSSIPTGAINGLFTVNANGDQVYFSQGNLQYIGSAGTPYWKFAEHQWDYLGETTSQNSDSKTVDRDLFGWGTSGYDHGANCYQPWSTSESYSDYYAYGNWEYNLYDQTGMADWGYNAISNGGSGWRTLTNDEWAYVFDHHTKGWSTVAGVGGYVIRPDGVETAVASSYAAEAWATEEAAGSVFLPAAGNRDGTSVSSAGSFGYYWSSSYNDSYYARNVYFVSGYLSTGSNYRYIGFSVRLVRSAQ